MIPGIERQNTPEWLVRLVDADVLPIDSLLRNSLYYPSCGRDGDPVRYLGGLVHSFVYVDYGLEHDEVWSSLHHDRHGFTGYTIVHCRDVKENELTPHGWQPMLPDQRDGDPTLWKSLRRRPI
jgi:hypothetical protein